MGWNMCLFSEVVMWVVEFLTRGMRLAWCCHQNESIKRIFLHTLNWSSVGPTKIGHYIKYIPLNLATHVINKLPKWISHKKTADIAKLQNKITYITLLQREYQPIVKFYMYYKGAVPHPQMMIILEFCGFWQAQPLLLFAANLCTMWCKSFWSFMIMFVPMPFPQGYVP